MGIRGWRSAYGSHRGRSEDRSCEGSEGDEESEKLVELHFEGGNLFCQKTSLRLEAGSDRYVGVAQIILECGCPMRSGNGIKEEGRFYTRALLEIYFNVCKTKETPFLIVWFSPKCPEVVCLGWNHRGYARIGTRRVPSAHRKYLVRTLGGG